MIRILLLFVCLNFCFGYFNLTIAQSDNSYLLAEQYYSQKQSDSAKRYVDISVLDDQLMTSSDVWTLRGYIYKDIYKKNRNEGPGSIKILETAMESIKKSISLDTLKENSDKNMKCMNFLLSVLHNKIAEALNPVNYQNAIGYFKLEQKYFHLLGNENDVEIKKDIDFYLALGSVYCTIIESTKDSTLKANYIKLAESTFQKVLSIDPQNTRANYNLGVLYYNQGIRIVKGENQSISRRETEKSLEPEKSNKAEAEFEPNNMKVSKLPEAKEPVKSTGLPKLSYKDSIASREFLLKSMPYMERVEVSYIYFDFNSYIINISNDSLLGAVAKELKTNNDLICYINGYTDDIGANSYNLKLSALRAKEVKKQLIKLGLDAAKIVASGKGENDAIYPNNSPINRSKNRRAEIRIRRKA